MYNVFLEAMNETFDLTAMLAKIDYHHIRGNLTDAEREELIALAREKANPYGGVDIMSILADHDARLRALEGAKDDTATDTETVEEYVPGKWYRAGDRCTYNGIVYTCIAPDGVVCVWSPAEYPDYWEAA
jgi:hypothetical protein